MRSVETGPIIVVGNTNPAQLSDTDVGPSLVFMGQGLVDPRQVQTVDAAPGTPVPGFYSSEQISLLDIVPQASAAANIYTIAASTVVPAGGNTTPAAVTPSASSLLAAAPNVPLVPFGSAKLPASVGPASPVVTVPMTIDYGFVSVGTTSGSPNITVASAALLKYFFKGQQLCIPGAGSSTTSPLLATVLSVGVAGATTVVLSANAGQTVASAPCGTLDYNGAGAWPWIKIGATAILDPTQVSARALRVVNNNVGDTGYSVTVRGWDIYGVPMTETIAVTANGTAYGKKAWKYINTWSLLKTGGGTTAGTITIGTSDVYGLPLRSDFFEYMSMYYNQAFLATNGSANPLWTAADTTNPSTATTGDVRGTVQIGAAGGGASTATAPNGSIRFACFMSVPAYNAVNSTNLNYASLLGMMQNNS